MDHFYNPTTLNETLDLLQKTKATPIAGGTDLIPQMKNGLLDLQSVINLSNLDELHFIREETGYIDVGSCTTITQILASPLLQQQAPSLIQAGSQIGSIQTRNRATLGGNIGNASPAGDTLPPLLIHNAQIALIGAQGTRFLALEDFLSGPKETKKKPEEIIYFCRLEKLPQGMHSAFLRLGNRSGMAVSIASAALGISLNPTANNLITDARLALGAVAPTATRVPAVEKKLIGRAFSTDIIRLAARESAQLCSPIDDVRASIEYRRHVVKKLIERAFLKLSES